MEETSQVKGVHVHHPFHLAARERSKHRAPHIEERLERPPVLGLHQQLRAIASRNPGLERRYGIIDTNR